MLPRDGKSIGEFEIRGPWITGSYFGVDDPDKFHDGWLRTGDIGTLDAEGFMVVSDRTKDVIKSGGEWISSVDLEVDHDRSPGRLRGRRDRRARRQMARAPAVLRRAEARVDRERRRAS